MLQLVALLGKTLREALHQLRNQLVGTLHRISRLIDEARLNLAPAVAKFAVGVVFKQRLEMPLVVGLVDVRLFCSSTALRSAFRSGSASRSAVPAIMSVDSFLFSGRSSPTFVVSLEKLMLEILLPYF